MLLVKFTQSFYLIFTKIHFENKSYFVLNKQGLCYYGKYKKGNKPDMLLKQIMQKVLQFKGMIN